MCTCLLICCPGGRGETSQPAELEEMARAANPEEIDIDDDEDEDEMEGERPGGTLAGHQYVVGGEGGWCFQVFAASYIVTGSRHMRSEVRSI